MKQIALNGAIDILHKIETIEKEIVDLKLCNSFSFSLYHSAFSAPSTVN